MNRAQEWLREHNLDFGDDRIPRRILTLLTRELDAEITRYVEKEAALSAHISKLVIQLSRTKSLETENEALRQQVAQLQRLRDPHTPSLPGVAAQTEEAVASAADYAALIKRCDVLELNAEQYQKAIDYLTQKCRRLKGGIQQWSEYKTYREQKASRSTHETVFQSAADRFGTSRSSSDHVSDSSLQQSRQGGLLIMSPAPPTDASSLSIEPSYKLKDLEDLALLSSGNGVAVAYADLQPLGGIPSPGMTRTIVELEELPELRNETNSETSRGPEKLLLPCAVGQAGERLSSSQTTETEGCVRQHSQVNLIAEEPDEVKFVSARPVYHARRRVERSVPEALPPTTLVKEEISNVLVKQEAESDDAGINPAKRVFARTLTDDLDSPGIHVNTPTKRTRYSEPFNKVRPENLLVHEASSGRSASMPSLDVVYTDEQCGSGALLTLHRSNSDPSQHSQESHEQTTCRTMQGQRSVREGSHSAKVLTPISPNQQVLPRTSMSRSARRRRGDEDKSMKTIDLVTEDGDMHERRRSRSGKPRKKSNIRTSESDRRLNNLLDERGNIERQVLNVHPTPMSGAPTRTAATELRKPAPEPATPLNRAVIAGTTVIDLDSESPPVKREAVDCNTSSERREAQDERPVRFRPVQELTLDDFKPNPEYIGHYAAFDVVRDRDTRLCLPGCTRPCCTTAFRALIEAGAQPLLPSGIAPPSQGNDSTPSSPSGAARTDNSSTTAIELPLGPEDHRLLQHHLGASYSRSLLARTPGPQLRELLDQARARLMAERHGKQHRRVWERARSPPGFWRADMPSTQQAEEDRRAAARMVRERVRERWEDARRGGGRWVFRDE